MAASPQRPTRRARGGLASQLTPYARYAVLALGALSLLLGSIAVFTTINGLGALALLLVGVILVTLGVFGGSLGSLGGAFAVSADNSEALTDMLSSADPQTRTAAAEAVLEVAARRSRGRSPDTRDAALGVLLERDLIRRLTDLLRRGGYEVSADSVNSDTGTVEADVVVTFAASPRRAPGVRNPGCRSRS